MSHFTVLVMSKDAAQVETLMEPYDEAIEVAPYWRETNIDWALEQGQQELPLEEKLRLYLAVLGQAKYPDDGRYRVRDGKVEEETTYNPDSKWDYWTVGGRWAATLPLKPGRTGYLEHDAVDEVGDGVDQARKDDIDIEGMRTVAVGSAEAAWDLYEQLLKEAAAITVITLQDLLEAGLEPDKAREDYRKQPVIRLAVERGLIEDWATLEARFPKHHTRESFIEHARLNAIAGFAFLSEETGWLEPGRIGWFATSTKTPESMLEYLRKVNAIIDEAPDSALLTIVDCHI